MLELFNRLIKPTLGFLGFFIGFMSIFLSLYLGIFICCLGEFLGYILLLGGWRLFPLGYRKASHLAKAFEYNMTLLLLGALAFLNICRWLRHLGTKWGSILIF
jgi:hypothetical protein